jgi:hypothetical protein
VQKLKKALAPKFKVGSKPVTAASTPVLLNQKKTVLQNRQIH